MSFDLAVWYEGLPLSHVDAAVKYELLRRNEDAGLAASPGLDALYVDLVARFPVRPPSTDDSDHSVWAGNPEIVANAVRLSIHDAAVTAVRPAVEELAEREGLVCFDPQRSRIRLPSAMELMQMYGGAVDPVTTPDLETIAQAVATTASERSHLVLEKGTQRYVQVSPALHGAFGVEYRDGGADRHFRYETTNLPEVADIFASYARGNEEWRHRYAWERFQL